MGTLNPICLACFFVVMQPFESNGSEVISVSSHKSSFVGKLFIFIISLCTNFIK
jgi:hypothetical protein